MKKFLGYGGVGDCLVIILKLLQQDIPTSDFEYTHVESTKEKLKMCEDLLNLYNIRHKLVHAPNLRGWWHQNHKKYDKCFNLCAAGYVNVPPQDFHWAPCRDEGIQKPFADMLWSKKHPLCVQVNGGLKDNHKKRHFLKQDGLSYIEKIFGGKKEDVVWVGIDDSFTPPFGVNYSGKLSLEETLVTIASSEVFLGFNSILLYWALHNRVNSHLFMDHQGRHDVRIHEDWKKYLTFIDG